jgi:hypothetical protein
LDLIIDDGLHSPSANVAIWILAGRKLRVGGWFVIEDIALAALPIWQTIAALMADQYQTQIVSDHSSIVLIARRKS